MTYPYQLFGPPKMDGFQRKLISLLLKFEESEFSELFHIVFEGIIKWETVKAELDNKKLDKIRSNIARACSTIYQNTRPSTEDVMEKLWLLMLCDVSFHYKHQWFGIKLEMPFPDDPPLLDNIEKLLKRAYRHELRECEIVSLRRRHCLWLIVVETKKRKNTTKYGKPLFFAYNASLNVPFAFFTPKLTENYPLLHFAAALGFQDVRQLDLSSQNVSDMYDGIVKKTRGVVNKRNPFNPITPIVNGPAIIFSGLAAKQAQKLFIGDSKITKLTVDCFSSNNETGLSGNSLMTIKCIRDDTLETILREMIGSEVIQIPIPEWARSFDETPRSVISLGKDIFGRDCESLN